MSKLLLMGAGGPVIASGPALWTPNDDAGLLGWWDMSNPSSYSGTTWTKRWGTLANLTANATGPTKITTGFSGDKNSLEFNGNTDQGMFITNPNVTEMMFVCVMNVVAVTGTVNPLIMNRGLLGVTVQSLQLYENFGISAKYQSNPAEDYDATIPGQLLLVTQLANARRAVRNNGELFAENLTVASGTAPATSDSIQLCRFVTTGVDWICEIAAIGVFTSSSWSTSLAEKIEGFVAHNNIGVSTTILPIGHTYKTNAPTV